MERRDFLAVVAATPFFTLKDLEAKKMRFPFLLVDEPNKNNRVYTRKAVEHALDHLDNSMIGHLGMTQDARVHFSKASHIVSNISFETVDNKTWLYGDIKVLDTPHGKLLQQMFNDGVAISFRTCGVGGFTEKDGQYVINDTYYLSSINAIPSEDAA
jgi:hypothetical protein